MRLNAPWLLAAALLCATATAAQHGHAAKKPARARASMRRSFTHMLVHDPDPLRRESVALVLGTSGNRWAIPLLIARLRQDKNRWVRARCAEALGLIGDPSAIRPLRAALEREKPQRVRRAIAQALVQLGQRAGLEELMWQLRAGNQHEKAEVMKFLVRTTGQPLGQDTAAWWRHFGGGGYLAHARRPPGSPAVRELRGLPAAAGQERQGPWLFAAKAPRWQISCAIVLRLRPRTDAIALADIRRLQRRAGGVPDGCLLLIDQAGTPRGPGYAGLTIEAAHQLLAAAPNLLGIGTNGPQLDSANATGAPVRKLLLRRDRMVLEGVGDLDLVSTKRFRLLVTRSAHQQRGRYKALLLAITP